ncbi:nitroreductase family protein [uncultured Pseudokineococcus sp.]|uniref:nitroreductase family protein n=1 Tax=uncultured Pseudokineococcus sp. TaxID=1642928 RepID=UPI00262FA3AF|nr:nitroreductase family protein [uncultured Pseudokineococcus sp.]
MELPDVVRARRACRSFDAGAPVPRGLLRELVDLATRAPSAGASQGWDFLVLAGPGDVARYWAATTDPVRPPDRWLRGLRTAPALVLAWSREEAYRERYALADKASGDHAPADPAARWPVPYWHVDTGMAVALLLLGAEHAGLGACPFAVPTARVAAVREAFGVPPDRVPVMAVALGTPAPHPDGPPPGGPRASRRRPLDDVAHDGRFGTPLR